MVMPRSRSSSMESSTWLVISRSVSAPVAWISRSARVDFPWSIWAMIAKLRMWSIEGIASGQIEARAAGVILDWGDYEALRPQRPQQSHQLALSRRPGLLED